MCGFFSLSSRTSFVRPGESTQNTRARALSFTTWLTRSLIRARTHATQQNRSCTIHFVSPPCACVSEWETESPHCPCVCDCFAVVAALWYRRHFVMFSWKRVLNRYASVSYELALEVRIYSFVGRKTKFWTFFISWMFFPFSIFPLKLSVCFLPRRMLAKLWL